jgi:opacity protein-like surface antigen
MKRFWGLVVLVFVAGEAAGQSFSRAGLREYSLQPLLLDSRTYDFAAGASARIDGGFGVGLGFAWHLNSRLAWGVDISLADVDYRARITPAGGNTGSAQDMSGSMERGTLRVHGTWHLLSGRTTPLVTAGLGFTHLDPDLEAAPSGGRCWDYPWWGRFCGAEPPTHGMTRLSYALGAGVRHDLAANRGFVRFMASGEWIDWTGSPERLGNLEFRADFGAPF